MNKAQWIKHLKNAPKQAVEDLRRNYAFRKLCWNSKQIPMNKRDINDLIAFQQATHELYGWEDILREDERQSFDFN